MSHQFPRRANSKADQIRNRSATGEIIGARPTTIDRLTESAKIPSHESQKIIKTKVGRVAELWK
jgi:hypothetical protein